MPGVGPAWFLDIYNMADQTSLYWESPVYHLIGKVGMSHDYDDAGGR